MIQIRQVTPASASFLDNVAEDVFDHAIDHARLARYVTAPGHLMLVALDDALVVGQCAAVIHYHPDKPTELYIDELGVSPRWQRQGIGRQLLEGMLAMAGGLGCEEVWVGTEPHNAAANALYRRWATGEPFLMYVWEA